MGLEYLYLNKYDTKAAYVGPVHPSSTARTTLLVTELQHTPSPTGVPSPSTSSRAPSGTGPSGFGMVVQVRPMGLRRVVVRFRE